MTRAEAEEKYGVKLTPEGLYPDRSIMHRNMGPPELFPCCGGRGYIVTENGDRYCDCAAGNERKRTDSE